MFENNIPSFASTIISSEFVYTCNTVLLHRKTSLFESSLMNDLSDIAEISKSNYTIMS